MPQRVEGSIEIEAPVERVYDYWENLENLPLFMTNVEEVRATGPETSHWKIKGPLGASVEFDARTTQKVENEALAWNSADGEVGTSGQVHFREVTPNRTRVEVVMNYSDPPGGKVGEVASRAISDPKMMLEQDLKNLKDILEGKASPEEVQQRAPAATVQSAAAVMSSGTGLAVLGGALVLFMLIYRRRGGGRRRRGGRRPRIILEL